jgi:hypothetical protein
VEAVREWDAGVYWSAVCVAGIALGRGHGGSDGRMGTDRQLFQNFDFRPHNLNYELEIKSSLTIKPAHFYMHVSARKDRDPASVQHGAGVQTESHKEAAAEQKAVDGLSLAIYYGMSLASSLC